MKDEKIKQLAFGIHKNQIRKFTEEPYSNHLENVGMYVKGLEFKFPGIVHVAWFHDSVEDQITKEQLASKLRDDLPEEDITSLLSHVMELTDVYTSDSFPEMSRKERKELERQRLSTLTPLSQTVKYADIIDNVQTIHMFGSKFAKIYLNEKFNQLNSMDKGDSNLRIIAYQMIIKALLRII